MEGENNDMAIGVEEGDVTILFAPLSIQASITASSDPNDTGGLDRRMVEVHYRSISTAWLVLYNDQGPNTSATMYILDLMAKIYKETEKTDEDGQIVSISYNYVRLNEYVQFESLAINRDGVRDIQAFDFILGQFCIKEVASVGQELKKRKDRRPNAVALGIEGSGAVVRTALRSGGRLTGHAIRYLGRGYTSLSTSISSPSQLTPSEHKINKAKKHQKWAQGFHSGARTVTSAALYPVRYIGSKAAAFSPGGNTTSNSESSSGIGKVLLDTVAGLGNGAASVCKGVTEALGEIGSAIGDSAMHHSRTVYGEDYAEQVTKTYVDAAAELGKAGYKFVNVASIGIYGIMLDAMIEGSTLLISLYEYLLGPVLLQGYMFVLQPPMLRPKRFFVVLRPWSIALYRHSSDFTDRPVKIIITSLLDTLPKLHLYADERREVDVFDQPLDVANVEPVPLYDPHVRDDYFESMVLHEDVEPPAATPIISTTSSLSSKTGSSSRRFRNVLHNWAGGQRSHIELTTLDCSTYLLYPETTFDDDDGQGNRQGRVGIEEWFEEVRKACSRVETIAKRKSGAEDIALERRLRLFPRTHVLVVEVQRFILGQPKGAAPYEGPAEAVAKAAAESGESDGDGEMLGENVDWQVYEGEADEEMEGDSKDSTEGAMEPNPPIETAEIDQKPSAAPTLDTASDLSSSHKKCVVQGTFKSKESARRFLGHRWLPSTVQVVVTPIATEHVLPVYSERCATKSARLQSLDQYLRHWEVALASGNISDARRRQIEEICALYRQLPLSRALADWESLTGVGDDSKATAGRLELGNSVDLFNSGDVKKLEFVVRSSKAMAPVTLGVAEAQWDDLLYLLQFQVGVEEAKGVAAQRAPEGGSREVWLPVFHPRSQRTVGHLLVTVEVIESSVASV